MRILLYTDVHISQNSSIINTRGNKYSTRLENIIKSLNWAEEQAIVNKCDSIICLGDLFDRSDLNAEEITALKEIKWANLPHTLIVGNHESNVVSLDFSSAFSLNNVFDIINKPCSDVYDDFSITYLPYIVESERKPIKEYLPNSKKKIILSHNDIKGIQYGQWISKDGFDFVGKKHGVDFSFHLDPLEFPTIGMVTDTSKFAVYYDGEFYEILPENKSTIKWLFLVEETHRLNGGKWQDFKFKNK